MFINAGKAKPDKIVDLFSCSVLDSDSVYKNAFFSLINMALRVSYNPTIIEDAENNKIGFSYSHKE